MLGDFNTFTSFSCSDLEVEKKFFTDLGITISAEFDGGIEFKTGGDTKFMVYIKDNHMPATHTVMYFEVEDVEKSVKELNTKGIEMEKYPDMGTDENGISKQDKYKMAWFKDPAGNIFSLISQN